MDLFKWFRKRAKPVVLAPAPTVYPIGPVVFHMAESHWGNRIEWFTWPTKVVGWLDRMIHPDFMNGCCISCDMQSGKTAIFQLTNIDWCSDPRDMFFADATFVRYKD